MSSSTEINFYFGGGTLNVNRVRWNSGFTLEEGKLHKFEFEWDATAETINLIIDDVVIGTGSGAVTTATTWPSNLAFLVFRSGTPSRWCGGVTPEVIIEKNGVETNRISGKDWNRIVTGKQEMLSCLAKL